MSAVNTTANNSDIQPSNHNFDVIGKFFDFVLKYLYENPFGVFEQYPTIKRYSLIAIHAAMILLLMSVLPAKMSFISYSSSFWIGFLILMIFLTDNLYDTDVEYGHKVLELKKLGSNP